MINVVALAFGILLGGGIIGWLVTYWVIVEMALRDLLRRSLGTRIRYSRRNRNTAVPQ